MPQKKKEVEKKILIGRPGNSLKMGIVGLPNIGKSSTYNILTKLSVPAENYPFCTIDPSFAKIPIPDIRFEKLSEYYKPKSKQPATITIFDIAGLVPNAHEGEGLGNEFLSHIQAVDGIYHLVRAFKDPEITHISGEIDPVRDLDVINKELFMKDTQLINNKMEELEKLVKRSNDKQSKDEIEILLKVKEHIDNKRWIKDQDWTSREILFLNNVLFFTAKPVVYLINISKNDFIKKKNPFLPKIKEWIDKNCKGIMIPYSVEYENELLDFHKNGEKLDDISMVDKISKIGYSVLELIHFFTAGKDEVKCWTIRKHSKAPQAAGRIHTDFEKGFICADITKYDDFISLGSEQKCKSEGKVRQQGKEYEVEDGDICFFKFNPPKASKKK